MMAAFEFPTIDLRSFRVDNVSKAVGFMAQMAPTNLVARAQRGACSSVRNNGRTSDIYRTNEAFVRPFVISPDILSGGVAAGVEFHMSNPHPRTSQCHVNNVVSAVCARNKRKQPRVVRVRVLYS